MSSTLADKSWKSRFFGDKAFYKMVFKVTLPIMIQNGFTNLMGLIDNVMVGQIGTEQMSGVAIVNQILFVYYLSIFGGLAGAGIFVSQYYGRDDQDGIRHVFRMKVILGMIFLAVGLAIFLLFQEPLIQMFLHEGSDSGNLAATMKYAKQYLNVMIIGLIPFTINQVYSSTLREMSETVVPMKAGIVSVIVNLLLNYVLIFGKFGFPELGVIGAAIATVVGRFIECLIVFLWTHRQKEEMPFLNGVYQSLYVPKKIVVYVLQKGMPLLANEFLWSAGMTAMTYRYSTRGLAAIAGINICNTLNNVFNIVFIALGSSVAIIVGQLLGAGKLEEAKRTDTRMITFSVLSCLITASLMALFAPLFPQIYNTTEEVRQIATRCIWVMAGIMPFAAFTHSAYFTLRAGGCTMVTVLFDSCYVWGLSVPLAFVLSIYTNLSVEVLFLCCQSLEILKSVIGFLLVKKGIWLKTL